MEQCSSNTYKAIVMIKKSRSKTLFGLWQKFKLNLINTRTADGVNPTVTADEFQKCTCKFQGHKQLIRCKSAPMLPNCFPHYFYALSIKIMCNCHNISVILIIVILQIINYSSYCFYLSQYIYIVFKHLVKNLQCNLIEPEPE